MNKGIPQRVYTNYGDARHDLAGIIGYYCSYCEMRVYNSIEVEHILPRNQGGAALDWNNFLLSCKFCNTIKSDHNNNIDEYFWPDVDNTDLAFSYSEADVITPAETLNQQLTEIGKNTIRLMGLDRFPGGIHEPTKADTRWRARETSWTVAKKSYLNWLDAPIPAMASQIANTARTNGNYSIWMKVFSGIEEVQIKIDAEYRKCGLYKEYDNAIKRKVRPNGKI